MVVDLPPALAGHGGRLATIADWLEECERVERCRTDADLPARGAMITLHMRTGRALRSRQWSNVAVMPGVRGRVIGEIEPRYYLIEVLARDVRAALAPGPADGGSDGR